jgi:outer membrane receptor for ferrienterochelin and colicin
MAVVAPATGVAAQAAPEPAAPATSQKAGSEADIVVVAPERSSIDRTTYVVRDNAEARSSNALDVLAQVPTVDVLPTGQVRLLGRPGVTILVDGKQVPDPQTFLRNLQGSQVARIEVISNPSAQFSAQGTAGIINIVTRRSFAPGIGGSVTANAGSYGNAEFKVSPTWSRGPLSVSGALGATRFHAPSRFERDRNLLDQDGNVIAHGSESARLKNRIDNLSANLLLGYKLSEKQNLGMSAIVQRVRRDSSRTAHIVPGDGTSGPLDQTSSGDLRMRSENVSADYRREGSREGETLTVSVARAAVRTKGEEIFSTSDLLGGDASLSLASDASVTFDTVKTDYVRPFGKKRRLSVGATAERVSSHSLTTRSGRSSPTSPDFALSAAIAGRWLETSAYVTYQAPFLGGTLLGGIRVEGRRYRLPGEATEITLDRSHPFPSLHLERRLNKRLTANLSYSRRIAWPGIEALSPLLRFSDPTTATSGNPELRPELTDSWEAKLKASVDGHSLDATAFARRTRSAWSDYGELNGAGIFVTRTVNVGGRTLLGGSASARGPLGGGFRYSISANWSDQRYQFKTTPEGFLAASPEYGAFAQLEYRDGTEGKPGTDRVVVNARYRGPTSGGFYRSSAFVTSDFSWSHTFSRRISGVLKVSDLLGAPRFRTTYFSNTGVSRQISRSGHNPRFTLSLTYSLSPPDR